MTLYDASTPDKVVIDAITAVWGKTLRKLTREHWSRVMLMNDTVTYNPIDGVHWCYVRIDYLDRAWLGVKNDGTFVYGTFTVT
jgi:hypothetical protein